MRPRPSLVGLTAFAAVVSVTVGCKRGEAGAGGGSSAAGATCPTCVIADERGFTPSYVEVPAGKPGELRTLTFTRLSNETCATEVVVPDLNIKKDLPLKQPVTVNVPAGEKRTFTFTCGMGMYKSAIVVN